MDSSTLPDIDNIIALADFYEVTVDSLVRNVAAYSGAGTPKQHMFGLVRVNDVRARARGVGVRRLGAREVALAGEEHAVGPDAVAERLHAEL